MATDDRARPVGRFLLLFLELQMPMVLGASVCYLLGRLIPASSSFATAYHPGTYLFTIGDVLFLTGPVVTWMIFRGHGWRHSLEMALAMLAPVAVIMVVGQLAGYAYLLSLVTAMYPAMCLGMLAYMLTAVATSRDGWATLPRAHPPRMRSLEDGSPINDAPAAPG
jgi:hypothetical protein